MPSSITKIGGDAFSKCSSVKNTYFNGDIAQWCNIEFENAASNPCYAYGNLYINDELLTVVNIPFNVEKIGNYAFYHCKQIQKVTIEYGVKTIGHFAFCGTAISSVSIPASINNIGLGTFSESQLRSASFASSSRWYRYNNSGGFVSTGTGGSNTIVLDKNKLKDPSYQYSINRVSHLEI